MSRWLLILVLLLPGRSLLAAPALWAVHGPNATVYLLGSLHLLRPGMAWESPAIDRAFDEAQECWFEIDMSGAGNVLGAGVALLNGFDFAHRLSDRLSPAAWDRLGTATGLDPERLQHLRPWLVETMLALHQWSQTDFSPEAGVEHVLLRKAKAAGKPVRGIETAPSQMRLLADRSDADALRDMERMLAEPADTAAMIDQLATMWLAGDIEAIGAQVVTKMENDSPELARRLLTDRNVVFADAVSRLLKGDKTVLLTVGAAHMVGPGGVPVLLEKRGWTVGRVE